GESDVDCDCASAFDDRTCGPDPGVGSRPRCRAGHARGIARARSKIRAAMPPESVGIIASARSRGAGGNCHVRSSGTGRGAITGLTIWLGSLLDGSGSPRPIPSAADKMPELREIAQQEVLVFSLQFVVTLLALGEGAAFFQECLLEI